LKFIKIYLEQNSLYVAVLTRISQNYLICLNIEQGGTQLAICLLNSAISDEIE